MAYAFRLYLHPEVPELDVPQPEDGQFQSPSDQFIEAWVQRFGGFDYGHLTVWLMRGFGLPNVRVYDTFKHSFCWGLETPEGYVIQVEPGLRRVPAEEYRNAPDNRDDSRVWSKKDWVRSLQYAEVFRLHAVRPDAPPVSAALFDAWLNQFARPIYVRDVGADVMGPLAEQGKPDVGPGSHLVLDGGANLADSPTSPGSKQELS